jgi:hypothetical protein
MEIICFGLSLTAAFLNKQDGLNQLFWIITHSSILQQTTEFSLSGNSSRISERFFKIQFRPQAIRSHHQHPSHHRVLAQEAHCV